MKKKPVGKSSLENIATAIAKISKKIDLLDERIESVEWRVEVLKRVDPEKLKNIFDIERTVSRNPQFGYTIQQVEECIRITSGTCMERPAEVKMLMERLLLARKAHETDFVAFVKSLGFKAIEMVKYKGLTNEEREIVDGLFNEQLLEYYRRNSNARFV